MEKMKNKKAISDLNDTYDLGIYNNIKFALVVPSKTFKGTKKRYYIYYYYLKSPRQYGAGVKALYLEYLATIAGEKKTVTEKAAVLQYLFKYFIEAKIIPLLNLEKPSLAVDINTPVLVVIDSFLDYHRTLVAKGELKDITNYKARTVKLKEFFQLDANQHLRLRDLNEEIWERFRDYFLDQGHAKSSINQYVVYAGQMYSWLTSKKVKIFNDITFLKPLDTSLQKPKYKLIEEDVLDNFFETLEKEKYNFTRLYLACLLVYENTLRPVQVCSIQLKNVNLRNHIIRDIYDAKSKKKKRRHISITNKVAELIQIIIQNTENKGIVPDGDMYLIGGYDRLKSGIQHTPKDLRENYALFKKRYKGFDDLKIYENKKTSITTQFKDKEQLPDAIRQRAGHSKLSTTEIYNEDAVRTEPYKLKAKEVKE